MPPLATGHKRTGACPTFEHPVLQRDGLLLRVPLVGGGLAPAQAAAVAAVAEEHGSGVIELTNRGNLQVRGLREASVGPAVAALRDHGLGDGGAALVTISPFASDADHALRQQLVDAIGELLADGGPISPKFVVHVDDAAGTTAARRSEATLTAVGSQIRVAIDALGGATTDAAGAVELVRALAAACRSVADDARVADVVDAYGLAWLHAVLPADLDAGPGRRPVAAPPAAGPWRSPDGEVLLAAARFGRLDAWALAGLAARGADLRVTPWRSFALQPPADGRTGWEDELAELGLIVDAGDPAAGIVSCIGAAGCWQTEADTWAEAERVAARRSAGGRVEPGLVHVSGCDKRCATRGRVAVTFLGRVDGTGFDPLVAP